MNEAETNLEMEPSPDAPQRAMTAAPQVHHAPLCAASGSKLKGLTGDAPVPHAHAANGDVIPRSLGDTPPPWSASPCG
ncbi:hypothetical protein ACFLYD_07470 [Chloroflexota bacterium]